MRKCGEVAQGKTITFRAIDNKKREDVTSAITIFEGKNTLHFEATMAADFAAPGRWNTTFTYDFSFGALGSRVGVVIFEVRVDGTQIPESPFKLDIKQSDCNSEDSKKESVEFGECVCKSNTAQIGGTCVSYAAVLCGIMLPLLILTTVGVYWYVYLQKRQADSLWLIRRDELLFNARPEIFGRGTFGLVLLAEYRGTLAAVKRVIPPKGRQNSFVGKVVALPLPMLPQLLD
jgi:hypothetical protein